MTARSLARLVGTFHNISYYAPELKAFRELGLGKYWRAYMAYRSAPMGIVPASVVEATFYNFAPTMVADAIPSAWGTTTPSAVIELRDQCIKNALSRALTGVDVSGVDQAASLALAAIDSCHPGARPLFAAHLALEVPDDPVMRLWHACTLWREHRGDGHNLALAAAGIDGIECHVLLAGKGVGNKDVIGKIRGWTDDEWEAAATRLIGRGLIDTTGKATESGLELRAEIESQTDDLAGEPLRRLGGADGERVESLLEPLVAHLVSSGAVAGSWPPKRAPA